MKKYILEENEGCDFTPDEALDLSDKGYNCTRCKNGNYKCVKKTSPETGKLKDTPFKSQKTGDIFRAWVIDNTDFENTNKTFKRSHSSYNSEHMKKAWKAYGQDFVNKTKYDDKTDTFPSGDPVVVNGNGDGGNTQDNVVKDNLKFNCDEKWEGNDNYFIRDFKNNPAEAARDFMDYYVRLYPSQFVSGGKFYNKCGVSTTPPYIQGDDIHRNPVVKYIANQRAPYRDETTKKVTTDQIYNIFFRNYKGSKTVGNNVSDGNQNQNQTTELQVLFTKANGIKSILDRNQKPNRKACKELIKFYDAAYTNHYAEKQPAGYTRENFKNQMNNTKYSIFYCMKNHPALSIDTKINKFSNVTNRDWFISLGNYSSNIIKENVNMGTNIKQTLRQKLVETKLVKSLKTEMHIKSLDKIADDFYGKNYSKFFNKIFEHTKTLQNSKGFINEEVTDSFQKAFNTLFYGNETKMKEQTINHILKELKVDPNSEIGVEITNELNGVPDSDVTKLLSDPTFVADKITSAIDKSVKNDSVDDDSLESMLRSSAVSKLKSTMDDIKFKIANRLTGVLDNARQSVESTSDEIKQSFIEKLSNKIAGF